MSRDTDKLLQECITGLDAGLTPEDCLSAWPEHRAELEPLLRQAMLLRVAYAAAPAEDFKARAREKMMFMAGREARQALSVQPSEAFVRRTRQRLLSAAGAAAQESLRSVPPPRLAFWMNARRRLLDAASSGAVAAPAPRAGVLVYRSALSAAVVVLAVAVASLAYFTVQAPKPSVSAELASIEQQLRQVEEQNSAGNPSPPSVIVDLASRTTATVSKINTEQAASPIAVKAQELIDRQQTLLNQAPPAPAVQQAREQLSQAEEKIRISAAGVASGITPVSIQSQPTIAPTTSAGVVPTQPAPVASASPVPPASTTVPLAALGPGDIRLRPAPADATGDISWSWLETERYRVLIPANWTVSGVSFDAAGLARYEVSRLTLVATGGLSLSINLNSGEINGLTADGQLLALRGETASGAARMTVTELVIRVPTLAVTLDHMLASVVHTLPTPTPTATPTSTSTPNPTSTP